jgi:MerR family transcriptional regulator/heat shock protein HspR
VDERDPVYTMAVASRLTGLHPQTLRKYERAGLLTPARQSGNQRLYSAADVERLRRIQYLVSERGLNNAGVELALAMADRLDALGADATLAEQREAIGDVAAMSRRAPRPPRSEAR